jgi:hypothetical protein
MKIVAAIPVNGRHTLIKHTISRLLTRCGVSDVICVGEKTDREICEKSGAKFEVYDNYPLGRKWNRAFEMTKVLNPDAVLFVGSSDWVSDEWCKTLYPHLENSDLVGKLGCHLLDISRNKRLMYWPGYKFGLKKRDSSRDNEPIGIGRLLSYEFLKKIDFKPFNHNQDSSLDWTMYNKASKVHISTDEVHSMAISTNKWPNKHIFEEHWRGNLPSQKVNLRFLDTYFNDAVNLTL